MEKENRPPKRKWTLKVNLESGYNLTDRTRMMEEVRRHFPELSHWVELLYGTSSYLNFGHNTIRSTTGDYQGDPLAGLLFSAALQPILRLLQDIPELTLNI